MFLSPDLKPIMGGTYFPPNEKYGRPGFKTVLRRIKEAWDSKRGLIYESGNNVIQQLSDALSTSETSKELTNGLAQQAMQLCASQVEELLGKENTKIFANHYYVKPGGNYDLSRMSDPHNEFQGIPERASKLGLKVEEYAEILGACREKLFLRRCCRPRPHLDDKVIVVWNGLAILAFA